MNSINGVIALCALLAGYGLIIGAVNAQKENFSSAEDSIKANSSVIRCAAAIDSIYSNAAQAYVQDIGCDANGATVKSGAGSKEKSFGIITQAKKGRALEIKLNAHYKE